MLQHSSVTEKLLVELFNSKIIFKNAGVVKEAAENFLQKTNRR